MGTYIATPTGDGKLSIQTHKAITDALRQDAMIRVHACSTVLCLAFNTLWAHALSIRGQGIDRFVLIHSDIAPRGMDWLTRLNALLDESGLDVLSVVSPIKAGVGAYASMALDKPDGPEKFTINEMPKKLIRSDMYGEPLLINTGLMIARLDQPWCEEFSFSFDDSIEKAEDGSFQAKFFSEDWKMSRWLHERKIPYGATNEIALDHFGIHSWGNQPSGFGLEIP